MTFFIWKWPALFAFLFVIIEEKIYSLIPFERYKHNISF